MRTASPPSSGDQPADQWDAKVSGLVLRTYISGHRTWFVRTRTRDGKRTRIKLGDHPNIGTKEARRLAMAQISAVQQGRDPVTERRAARQARREAAAALTVGMALARWQEARSTATDRPWSPRYVRAVASAVGVHVPAALRAMPLREVTREAWTRTISTVTRTKPGAAAFLFTSISSFLAFAETMGWIEQHPFLFDLLVPPSSASKPIERPVLETGAGGTTICEVHIRRGPQYGLVVQPMSDKELRDLVADFSAAKWVAARSEDKALRDVAKVSTETDRNVSTTLIHPVEVVRFLATAFRVR